MSNQQLLEQLNAVSKTQRAINHALCEVLMNALGQIDDTDVADELRRISGDLVSSGGELTRLGVEIGVQASQLGQSHESSS
jgi:hypothetical protein